MKNGYLYETHTHTKEASLCGIWTAPESVREHIRAGYDGMIITNHFFYGNTCIDRSLPWQEWVEAFCLPYHLAKREASGTDFQVFFGWESCYDATEFLIYGPGEEWLIEHPEIKDATIKEQFQIIHEAGGLIVHPHPFRKADYISEVRLFPEYIDAVEGYNACHTLKESSHYQPESDVKAREYAARYDFPLTSGSDSHHLPMPGGGMVFDRRLTDIYDFVRCVRDRKCTKYMCGFDE